MDIELGKNTTTYNLKKSQVVHSSNSEGVQMPMLDQQKTRTTFVSPNNESGFFTDDTYSKFSEKRHRREKFRKYLFYSSISLFVSPSLLTLL